jgi:Methyltransferase domain
MFFDDHPEFLETSSTSANVQRLNLRHTAIIDENREVLRGARVLDIASHDGRWSFAALEAGAGSVTGIEGRDYLVENANRTFAEKGVDPSRFTFITGDAHDVVTAGVGSFDVVMCLGFLYHTLRYVELFAGIRATGAHHLIIDTRVARSRKPVISVSTNPVEKESMAVEDRFSYGGRTLAGSPSMAALELMLDAYGYDVVHQTDWAKLLGETPGLARRYRNEERVTLLAVSRG